MMRTVASLCQLKITLTGIRPLVWRRVVVPADIALSDLHLVLQVAMGWTNSHLHSFTVAGTSYTMPYEEGALEELRMEDERKVRLNELVTEAKDRFEYDYDFGDNWQHEVLVEKIGVADPNVTYPLCLAGKRACPPEDCGGPWGYKDLLKILSDPKHPEYKEMKQWVGRKFDPEAFDLEKLNKVLGKLRA